MSKRKNDSDTVTRVECTMISSEIKRDLSAIKQALIGADMQGGLVKKINDIDAKVVDLALAANHRASEYREKEEKKEEKERVAVEAWSREKVALIAFASIIVGIVLEQLLRAVIP